VNRHPLTLVVDENIAEAPALLAPFGHLRLVSGRDMTARVVRDADALLVRSITRVDADLLADSRVRFVGSATSGYDHVDRDWLARRGIAFHCAPGANANSVVEYVLAAIARCDDHLERLLQGGAVGIIGYGHVGSLLARRLRRLGIDCRCHDPWLAPEALYRPASLAEVLACDVVTLHAALTRQSPYPSYHLLGAAELDALAPEALLINASRGGVVDNAALLAHLNRSSACAAVLDVWEHEPAVDPALLRRVRIGTAHIAGYSYDGKVAATRHLQQALAATLGCHLPDAASAVAEREPLVAPPASGIALLRWALARHYDILADDRNLRAAVAAAASPADCAAAFDHLRRTYPRRRELAGTRVRIGPGRRADGDLLRGLGCIIEEVA
jgi:erythronate-4-phosphate dehydrogenase